MSDDDKLIKNGEDHSGITATELKYVIEVNKKAIELYVEVEKQNEEILCELQDLKEHKRDNNEQLERLIEKMDKISTELTALDNKFNAISKTIEKIDGIDKNLFRLLVFLGVVGAGMIFQVFEIIFKH